jgi:H+-transporting ATPase
MDVLCLDKTGTITENRLTVAKLEASAPATADEVLRLAALASDEATQDPIDLAILRSARERGLVSDSWQRLGFVPFDPSTKRSEASVRPDSQVLRVVKGAPATVAELAQAPWPEIAAAVTRLSADGSRVLAVASGSESSLRMAGLVTLSDPPRPDSAALIADLRKRGVRVLLVTGDGEATARTIAAKVGITGEVAPAGTLQEEIDPQALDRFAIYAGVFPQDKFALVQALQRAGHMVGMTGDGVNDAPALRQADVGIAVAAATDVARAAASLALTRPGLGEIVSAIDESRRIYQRLRTFVLTLLTRKVGVPLFLALVVLLLFGVLVINPLLVVLLLFTTDIAAFALSTDRVTPSPTPDRWGVRQLVLTGVALGALLLVMSGAVFWTARNVVRLSMAETQTLDWIWLVFAGGQAALYANRARGFFWTPPHPGHWLMLVTLFDVSVVTLMATQGWLMAPISLLLVGSMFLLAITFLIGADVLKMTLTRLAARGAPASASPG